MKQHSKAYEQYCWVLEKNIVFEETVYHNGTYEIHCTHFPECRRCGGCRNDGLQKVLTGPDGAPRQIQS